MGLYDQTVGVLLIGIFFNTFLFGLVTYQFIVYANTKFKDPLWIRAIVWTLCITDTTHSTIAIYNAYDMCVTNYGNPESLLFVSWTVPVLAFATAFAAFITQIFLGHRVLLITKNKYITGVVGITSLAAFVTAIYVTYMAAVVHEIKDFGLLVPSVTAWLALQTTADFILTFILAYALAKSRTGFSKTDTVINRLIRGAVQTGVFASIFALGDMFCFTLLKGTYFYAMFAYPIGRIYTNTLMDTLNARINLRDMMGGTVDLDSQSNANVYHMHGRATFQGQSIHVQKEVITDVNTNPTAVASYSDEDVYSKTAYKKA
ncbi:hypothetical protein BDQ12DRAFT_654966 [Crucibulum laeve]|uniref:DUF6534 domain-containing protein n=1 Tax=Crucibulum laeve TaxID=68775 RepID=A0A5C3LSN2_9AGAR|nr:hypothetical protein BDQ12DRAFT_654966 [Crucibulum laeve]